MSPVLLKQVMRFGVVGSVGFVVDGGMLWVLLSSGLNPYVARALSFPVAVVVTWALNRTWTFSAGGGSGKTRQFNRYLGVQLVGVGVNYCVYSISVRTMGESGTAIFLALVLASFVGMFVNFLGARKFAFKDEGNDVADT